MFKTVEDIELNQISLTGMRSIVVLGLLIVAPRTLDEIRQSLLDLKIIEESHSNDILRIDLNTLKHMGCQISRASAKTDYKYVLGEHPFALKINKEELAILKRAYKKVKESNNFKLLLEYDELFKKIASKCAPESREDILGISALKYYDINFVKELMADCLKERVLKLTYKTPSSKVDVEKDAIAHKLVLQNDKLYLYCYDLDKNESIVLNVKRIVSIISRQLRKGDVARKITSIKFHLKDFGVETISDDEIILDSNDNGYVIEGRYHNEFVAVQRILSFGADCTVLEPAEFKDVIVTKLKEMRKIYD